MFSKDENLPYGKLYPFTLSGAQDTCSSPRAGHLLFCL